VTTLRPPGNSSSYAPRLAPLPELGQHTRSILTELGYRDDEISAFAATRLV
jgi:itaconate CoA-transferase